MNIKLLNDILSGIEKDSVFEKTHEKGNNASFTRKNGQSFNISEDAFWKRLFEYNSLFGGEKINLILRKIIEEKDYKEGGYIKYQKILWKNTYLKNFESQNQKKYLRLRSKFFFEDHNFEDLDFMLFNLGVDYYDKHNTQQYIISDLDKCDVIFERLEILQSKDIIKSDDFFIVETLVPIEKIQEIEFLSSDNR